MQSKRAALIANRYQILSRLGQGGMGIVYRALDRLRGQQVALKSISNLAPTLETSRPIVDSTGRPVVDSTGRPDRMDRSDQTLPLQLQTEPLSLGSPPATDGTGNTSAVLVRNAQDPMALRMALAQEFRTLASLRHPNIITVLDYGFDSKHTPFFTMELLSDACPLMLAAQDMQVAQRVELLLQVAQALVYLHRRGVLHRDLKPANILALPTPAGHHIKVLDFGLAMAKSMDVAALSLVGTLTYMAPELLWGGPPTEAADLYAFGVTAFELLVGRSPFVAGATGDVVSSILSRAPDTSDLPIPEPLRELLSRLLAKDPAARPRDASQLCSELAAAVGRSLPTETSTIRDSFLQAAAFVARDEEVATLIDALDEAEASRGSGWLIGGESGVGKSRLIEEVCTLARVRGVQVLRGETVRAGAAPYQALRDILRGLCLQIECDAAQASLLLPLIPDLPQLLQREVAEPPAVDAKSAQERLLRGIDDCFGLLRAPTVVVIEDVHWAGVEVILTLSRLVRSIHKRPIVLIASFRDDEAPWVPSALPAMELLKLARLDRTSVTALSESMLGPLGGHPDLIELLLRETEGNAFFMVEVLRTLAEERGMLSEIASNHLPDRVFAGGMRAVLERRLSRVPPHARPLLHLAAIAGRQLDLALLRTQEPQLDTWLETCANVAVLETVNQGWRFTHDKLRERLLEELTAEQRARLHRQVAELLELTSITGELDPSRLAYHYGEGGVADLAVHYSTMAGERALREGAIEKSLTYLNDLQRWQDQIEPRTMLAPGYRLAAGALLALGRMSESVARFELAWSTLGFPLPRPQELTEASARAIRAEVDAAVRSDERPVPGQATHVALEAIELAAQSLGALIWLGRHSSAYRVGQLGLGFVRQLGISSLQSFFALYVAYLHKLYSLEPLPELVPQPSPPNTDESGTLRELQNRLDGLLLLKRRHLGEAAARFRNAMQISREQGDELLALYCQLQITLALHYQGQLDQAQSEAAALVAQASGYGSNQYQAWGHTLAALGHFRKAQLGAARSELASARKNLDRIDDPLCLLLFSSVQARVGAAQGDARDARRSAERALALLEEHRPTAHEAIEPVAELVAVYAWLAQSAPAAPGTEPAVALERALSHLVRLAGLFELALPRALLLQGVQAELAGRTRRAKAFARLGLRHARRQGAVYEQARAHRTLSRLAPADSAAQQRHERACAELLGELGLSVPPLL